MKTKIIYISGSEIFNITDIRAAFEEVRNALQLDSDTVLFGVPVDQEDAGLGTTTATTDADEEIVQDTVIEPDNSDEPVEIIESVETVIEEIPTEPKTKAKRARKTPKAQEPDDDEPKPETPVDEPVETVAPILSVLSCENQTDDSETEEAQETEIIEDIATDEEIIEETKSDDIITEIDENPETENEGEPDLEKLLSAMTPLQEDALEENVAPVTQDESESDGDVSEDVDATLQQLATEFAETQDKIASETKSSGRSKIGKLRNILPFKQSKHKDQGLGDLFGWAGVAANDEDFSVPGFFTNASSKK